MDNGMCDVEWGGAAWPRYDGMLFSGSGKSRAETAAEDQQADEQAFYNDLTKEMNARYGQQTALLNQLKAQFEPVVAEGANQYGLGAGEDTALRTQSEQGTAQGYQQAAQALGNAVAGHDETGLPSGAAAQMQSSLATAFGAENADQQFGITQQGYALGRQNYDQALNALSGIAGIQDPLGYAGAAAGDANAANNSIKLLSGLETSPLSAVGGLLSLIPGIGAAAGAAGSLLGGAAAAPSTFESSGLEGILTGLLPGM